MNTNDLTVAIARHLESAGWHDAADYVRGDYITGKVSELMPPDLTDPAVVHANMLRGSIAKLTVDQVKHLYPDLCAYGQVQVLALEWKDDAPFFDDDPDSVIYSEAEGAGYTYVAEAVDCTLEEAKAACQAEFERRIIAALTPAPQVDSEHCGCGDKACLACFPATPTAQEAVPVDLSHGWLIHKAGAGWYRPNAKGYTGCLAEAGRYSREDALLYSHPNGLDGPRDNITIKHESEATTTRSDLCASGQVRVVAQAALASRAAHPPQLSEMIAAVERAFDEIRELNMSGRDENGHRWANSDLIDQTVTEGLVALRALKGDDANG